MIQLERTFDLRVVGPIPTSGGFHARRKPLETVVIKDTAWVCMEGLDDDGRVHTLWTPDRGLRSVLPVEGHLLNSGSLYQVKGSSLQLGFSVDRRRMRVTLHMVNDPGLTIYKAEEMLNNF